MMKATEYEPATGEKSGMSLSAIRNVEQCRIIAELGEGGMANVYLAVTQGSSGVQKLVVLKALRSELAAEPEALSMFLDEARLAAQLNHANVVQTYEVGSYRGRSVIVMEYLEGQSFFRLMRECQAVSKPLPLSIGVRILICALEGLHYAHELTAYDGTPLEIVHRDVSPQNIFITYDGQVKVLDFGIAKAASSSTQTAAGVIKGKFAYMAPEQMSGDAVDRRADLYSVGCMLWALAAGEKLWAGVPDGKVLRRVLAGDIPSPLEKNPDCDPELAAIVEKAMAPDREQRYATALEFLTDLERYSDKQGWHVRQKDIGRLTSELFASTRARIRALIEQQLSSKDAGDSTSLPLFEEGASISGAQSGEVVSNQPATRTSSSGRRWLAAVLTAAAGAAALFGAQRWLVQRAALETATPPLVDASEQARPAPAVGGEPVAQGQAAASASAPSVRQATIEFQIDPPDARLFLDGEPLPAGTQSRTLPADGAKHTLRAEARGYRTDDVEFEARGNTTVKLSLAKETSSARGRTVARPPEPRAKTAQPAPASAPAAAPASTPRATAPASTPRAAASCSDPFFIGADGIKRVRPECR